MNPGPWSVKRLRRWRRRILRSVFRHPLEAVVVVVGGFLFARLSPDRASRVAGRIGRGPVAHLLSLRMAERNLAEIMPELDADSQKKIARQSTGALASSIVEYLHTDALVRESDRIAVIGEDHAKRALEGEGGVVFATAHIANPEACRIAIQRLGAVPALIYRPPSNLLVRNSIRKVLRVIPAPLFERGIDHPRHMRRHVGDGGAILILVDQRPMGASRLPFLGRMARTATGPATLARRAGAAFLPVRCKRVAGRRLAYEVHFEAPIEGTDSAEMMAEMNTRIGRWVRDTPEQWLWSHDRWR